MQTKISIENILGKVEFHFFDQVFIFVVQPKGDGFLLQLRCHMKDNETGVRGWHHGGKYYISSHAIDDEIVLTAWKACQDFIMHEARETFFYHGQTIFHPHMSVNDLVGFCEGSVAVSRPKNLIVEHIKEMQTAQDIDI